MPNQKKTPDQMLRNLNLDGRRGASPPPKTSLELDNWFERENQLLDDPEPQVDNGGSASKGKGKSKSKGKGKGKGKAKEPAAPRSARMALRALACEHHFTLNELLKLLPDAAGKSLLSQFVPKAGKVHSPAVFHGMSHRKKDGNVTPATQSEGSKAMRGGNSVPTANDIAQEENSQQKKAARAPAKQSGKAAKEQESEASSSIPPRSAFAQPVDPNKIVLDTSASDEPNLPIFVYGSGMFPDLMTRLTRSGLSGEDMLKQRMCPATLSDWMRLPVKDCEWPAIIPVNSPENRLKADMAFGASLFPGVRNAATVSMVKYGSQWQLEPRGKVVEFMQNPILHEGEMGLNTSLKDIVKGFCFDPDDILESQEAYEPPKVKGMLVFGLGAAQRTAYDYICGICSSAGKPLKNPLFKKERVTVDFLVRVPKKQAEKYHANQQGRSGSGNASATAPPAAQQQQQQQQHKQPEEAEYKPFVPDFTACPLPSSSSVDAGLADAGSAGRNASVEDMSDDEYERVMALERKRRADAVMARLKPKIAAIREEERQGKMKKDFISAFKDSHQREVEAAKPGSGAAGSGTSTSTSTSSNSAAATGPGGDGQFEMIPISIEAYVYAWNSLWRELESPRGAAWDEAVYDNAFGQ